MIELLWLRRCSSEGSVYATAFKCLFEEERDNLRRAKHRFVPETSLCHISTLRVVTERAHGQGAASRH